MESSDALTLRPRTICGKQPPPAQYLKPTSACKLHAAVGLQPKSADDSDSCDELDPYAKAAIVAMGGRNVKKKAEHAAKQSLKMMKRRKKGPFKRPSGSAKAVRVTKDDFKEVSKADIMAAVPGAVSEGNPPPVHYGGGVVYTVQKNNLFRCIRVRGDKYTEKSTRWGKKMTKEEAWKISIDAINVHIETKKPKLG